MVRILRFLEACQRQGIFLALRVVQRLEVRHRLQPRQRHRYSEFKSTAFYCGSPSRGIASASRAQPMVARPVMSPEEQKMPGRFIRPVQAEVQITEGGYSGQSGPSSQSSGQTLRVSHSRYSSCGGQSNLVGSSRPPFSDRGVLRVW
ncbi:hypothetical protein HAX54_007566 [Datura stramonium]|uniref:Uncharacterized protein n=1 Tax=Datura stramonium TaxID=4076 RepID=A0ABS8TEP0_DATST|nr:hypothetical protein [Datura stramonium]